MKEPTILIADDDPEIRVGLRYFLESRGFHILVAGNGDEALKAIREGPLRPEVVVLDLKMPRSGGLTLLHDLKEVKDPPKIIVVTGLVGDTVAQAVESYGVTKVLSKPVALSIIEKAIWEALGKPSSS